MTKLKHIVFMLALAPRMLLLAEDSKVLYSDRAIFKVEQVAYLQSDVEQLTESMKILQCHLKANIKDKSAEYDTLHFAIKELESLNFSAIKVGNGWATPTISQEIVLLTKLQQAFPAIFVELSVSQEFPLDKKCISSEHITTAMRRGAFQYLQAIAEVTKQLPRKKDKSIKNIDSDAVMHYWESLDKKYHHEFYSL